MNYLLDTCVLSEYTKRKPNEKVIRWIDSVEETRLFLSVLTIGEIKKGVELLPDSHRKNELRAWFNDDLLKRFEGRLYAIDAEVMLLWGQLYAGLQNSGHPLSVMDSLIAATALYNNAILVTRNENDFLPTKVQLVNPW